MVWISGSAHDVVAAHDLLQVPFQHRCSSRPGLRGQSLQGHRCELWQTRSGEDLQRCWKDGVGRYIPFPSISPNCFLAKCWLVSPTLWYQQYDAMMALSKCIMTEHPMSLDIGWISESRIPALVSRLGVDPWCRSATLECWKGSATLAAAHVQMRHNETILLVAVFWFKSAFTRAVAALCTAGCVCIASKTPSKLVASCIVPHVATARRRSWSRKATPRVLGESGAKIV